MATKQQVPVLVARLVEHQAAFESMPAGNAQWVIQNTKEAIAVFIEAIENRINSERLFNPIGLVAVPEIKKPFVARDYFIVNASKKTKVAISYLGVYFRNNFLGKVEKPFAGSTLHCGILRKYSTDTPIIAELGEEKVETSLAEMFTLMEQQGNGEIGVLLTNGLANIFYVRDVNLVLQSISVYWLDGGGWSIDAFSVPHSLRWGAGSQFFSRNPFRSWS